MATGTRHEGVHVSVNDKDAAFRPAMIALAPIHGFRVVESALTGSTARNPVLDPTLSNAERITAISTDHMEHLRRRLKRLTRVQKPAQQQTVAVTIVGSGTSQRSFW